MELFRLKSLRVKHGEIFKKEITFLFSESGDEYSINAPFITFVLGPNGTGKSNLLKFLIEIYRMANDKKNNSEATYYPKGKYFLEYFLDDGYYSILNTLGWEEGQEAPLNINDPEQEKGIRFFKDGTEITAKELKIPNSIIALSIMLTDKYVFLRNPEEFPSYKYLGVRTNTNTAGTRTFISRTIDRVFEASHRKKFIDCIEAMLDFLELEREFRISYSPKYKEHFFTGKLSREKFEDFFINYKEHLPRRTTEPWSVATFKNLKETSPEIIPQLVDLLNHLSNKLEKVPHSRSEYFEFDLFDINPEITTLYPLLPYLHSLNIISYPEITLKKNDYYSISQSSSGEYHFISTIVGLLATITDKSLVLIDEPEISLHANWQMKFIDFLNKVFGKYNSAHFVICSHSHFLVSDLKGENSKIIGLRRRESNIETVEFSGELNTYGWSAEDVLYRIFNLKTTSNHFLEMDLRKALAIIKDKSQAFDELDEIIERLNKLELGEADPTNEIIKQIKDYRSTL